MYTILFNTDPISLLILSIPILYLYWSYQSRSCLYRSHQYRSCLYRSHQNRSCLYRSINTDPVYTGPINTDPAILLILIPSIPILSMYIYTGPINTQSSIFYIHETYQYCSPPNTVPKKASSFNTESSITTILYIYIIQIPPISTLIQYLLNRQQP